MSKMIFSFTFHGYSSRVQLTVLDMRDVGDDIKFVVKRLPNRYHKSTPFWRGTQSYYGTDFATAWRHITNAVPDAEKPKRIEKLLAPGP